MSVVNPVMGVPVSMAGERGWREKSVLVEYEPEALVKRGLAFILWGSYPSVMLYVVQLTVLPPTVAKALLLVGS
jgi:hypothetical protein